jgi:hypothetical protein
MDLTMVSLVLLSVFSFYSLELHMYLYFLYLLFPSFFLLFLAQLILFDPLYISLLFLVLTLLKLHPCFPGLL